VPGDPALDELTAAWASLRDDDGFRAELHGLLTNAGRPARLRAERFAPDRRIYLKRESAPHPGLGEQRLSQAVIAAGSASSGSSPNGAGQHQCRHGDRLRAVRARHISTWAARTCGAEPSRRLGLLGAGCAPSTSAPGR
jgi:hypothetical protein